MLPDFQFYFDECSVRDDFDKFYGVVRVEVFPLFRFGKDGEVPYFAGGSINVAKWGLVEILWYFHLWTMMKNVKRGRGGHNERW